MANRYFPATALGGLFYVDGLAKVGRWDAGRLPYEDEATAELLVTRVRHRKVHTIDELREVLRASERGLPAIRLWLHEELEEAVKRI
jgi:hypothetical protein